MECGGPCGPRGK